MKDLKDFDDTRCTTYRRRIDGETEILVEQQPPQGVFVCDHAGRVINEFSLTPGTLSPEPCTQTPKPETLRPNPAMRNQR
jgi:hypothetical protein